jgi:hypothetical protein
MSSVDIMTGKRAAGGRERFGRGGRLRRCLTLAGLAVLGLVSTPASRAAGTTTNVGGSTGAGTLFNFGGALYNNSGDRLNVQNGSLFWNAQTGSLVLNTDGGIIDNLGGYFNASGVVEANTTEEITTLLNSAGATIENGDSNGRGLIHNSGGAAFTNEGGSVQNQNGSQLSNRGAGSVLTNDDGGSFLNLAGFVNANGRIEANTTGFTTTLINASSATLNNGGPAGSGILLNAAQFTNTSDAVVNNRFGSIINNVGTGAVLANLDGAVLNNEAGITGGGFNSVGPVAGAPSTLFNYAGATVDNGGAAGAGTINNRAGSLFSNSGVGSTVNNENGSQLNNEGVGTVFTTTAGARLNNYNGYLDADGNLLANNTGMPTQISNLAHATLNNGDGTGAGTIDNSGGLIENSGAGSTVNNLNGSDFYNTGKKSVVTNTAGGLITNSNGYLDSEGNLIANATGATSLILNEDHATINNGDGTGAGTLYNSGGLLANTGAGSTINNENGSRLYNLGTGTVLTNNGGASLANYDGYLDADGNLLGNTTGVTSLILNEAHATLDNGDAGGAGTIFNSGGLLANSGAGSTINNQNGARLYNTGAASVLSNDGGATITNYNGYLDPEGNLLGSTTGVQSLILNEAHATLNNGDAGGAATLFNSGGLLANSGAGSTINNQNGARLYNIGEGTVLSNEGGASLTNSNGYLDASGNLLGNTTGATSLILNEEHATLDNGGAGGAGTLFNSSGLLANSGLGSTINNQNGSRLYNVGAGTVLSNSGGATLTNYNGYLDAEGILLGNTTGVTSLILNEEHATLDNGDAGGAGTIDNSGGQLANSGDGSTINNQNGSRLYNLGKGTVLSNSGGATLTNYDGYLDASGILLGNTTGATSLILNEEHATLNNGDAGGAGTIYNSGGQLANSGAGSTINNQNGSRLYNIGAGTVLSNSGGATLTNYNGYLDPAGILLGNTTGVTSLIFNEEHATLNNGDAGGAGTIYNDGGQLANSGLGSSINNQNGSRLYNLGVGTVLSNSGGATLTNYDGYLDSSGILLGNTTGVKSLILNEEHATLDNGDAGGAGTIFNSGGQLANSGLGSTINNQNGSRLYNVGKGTVLSNSGGATLTNSGGYLDSAGNLLGNTTGVQTLLLNEEHATLNNGDAGGAGTLFNSGGLLANSGAGSTINNQNGSRLYNIGNGTVLSNDGGATLTNYNGYLDSSGNLLGNTTGVTSLILNEEHATLDNGDAGGAGTIYNSGGQLANSGVGSTVNNQNGARLYNVGAGTVLSNSGGGLIANYNGYLDSAGNLLGNTTGATSLILNEEGATLNNGDAGGAGTILNAGAHFSNSGAGSIVNNQNGSRLSNSGSGSTLSNDGDGLIVNVSGYYDDSGKLQGNTTGAVSLILNENGATLHNGDSGGAGSILNLDAQIANQGTGTRLTNQDGSLITNSGAGATLENTNGARLVNDQTSTIINQDGATLTNAATLKNNGSIENINATVIDTGVIKGTGIYTQTGGVTEVNGSFTQATLNNAAGNFFQEGTTTITGLTTNSGLMGVFAHTFTDTGLFFNFGDVIIGAGATLDAASYDQFSGQTILAGGTLDPSGITVDGGTFGGSGDLIGDLTVSDATLDVGSGAPGELNLTGDYTQTGGQIVFDITGDGAGGFSASALNFDPSDRVSIDDATVVFDFLGGADPDAFFTDGLLNLNTFFQVENGEPFGAQSDLSSLFASDDFQINVPGDTITGYNAATGALYLNVSAPDATDTLWLLAPILTGMAAQRRRR